MYSKYKDADPSETVETIRAVFREIGIHMGCKTEKHVDGVYTSNLTDSACHWNTQGKGTTVAYCEASAYGEAMEHVCTHYAFDTSTVPERAKEYRGFTRYPDEKQYPVSKMVELSPMILEEMREPFFRLDRPIPGNEELVDLWTQILKSDTTPFVPFYHVNRDRCILLPDAVLSKLCGTNGGGSGNTPEEAIGHALDEIVERWCKYTIFSQRLTPPEVPDAYLEKRCPELFKLKESIEEHGELKVIVLDASLGKRYPVACIAVIDPVSRRYLVNFGCHPLFEIALERCFTEIFQDRRVVPELLERKDMAPWENFDPDVVFSQRNWTKLLEDDLGLWPAEFFGTEPSWIFAEWQEYESYSNKIGMQSQLNGLLAEGAEIFIRDVSFLGFPVYKVYIKGISTSHISFTEDILDDLAIVGGMQQFLRGELDRQQMIAFAEKVFASEAILGRMFFGHLTNEEFDLLQAAFWMEYGNSQRAYDAIRLWNGKEASIARRIIELSVHMPLGSAAGSAKRFTSSDLHEFIDLFTSEHAFNALLTYYGFSGDSRQRMAEETIQAERAAFMIRVKDYMSNHMVQQGAIKNVIR